MKKLFHLFNAHGLAFALLFTPMTFAMVGCERADEVDMDDDDGVGNGAGNGALENEQDDVINGEEGLNENEGEIVE